MNEWNFSLSSEFWLEVNWFHDLVIFSAILYKDNLEWQIRSWLCIEMIQKAQQMWIRIVLADGWSDNSILHRIASFSNVVLLHEKDNPEKDDFSMGDARRYAAREAVAYFPDAKYFMYMAPEKVWIINPNTIERIINPMREGNSTVIVAGRNSKISMPEQQRMVENRTNKRAMQIINDWYMKSVADFRRELSQGNSSNHLYQDTIPENWYVDFWFGITVWTQETLLKYYMWFSWKKWDADILPAMLAKKVWVSVWSVWIDFSYPSDQTLLEMRSSERESYNKKRISQYRYIMREVKKNFSTS